MKNAKKDVLFLLQFFYPEYVSSATLPFDTAKALSQAGYTVDVICGYPFEYSDEKDVPIKDNVDNIGIRRLKYLQLNRKSKIGRLINFFSLTLAMLFNLFRMKGYKVIFVYSNPPILPLVATMAAKIFRSKLVFVAYDLYPEIAIKTNSLSSGGLLSGIMRIINRLVFKKAAAVVVLSSEMKEFVIKNRKISDDKIFVIPNWCTDTMYLESKEKNIFSDLVDGRLVISYFGNMGIAQDMETVIETIILLKNDSDVCFLLAGHGAKFNYIKEKLNSENVENAYMFEFLKGKDFLDALSISDCAIISLEKGLTGLCSPSKSYSYMMQGLALIAIMDESDIVNDIREGAGIFANNGNSELIAKKIQWFKSNPETLQKMKKKCKEIYLEKYTKDISTGKYIELMKKLF